MPNVSFSHVFLALSPVGLVLLLLFLILVLLDLMWALGNEVIGASVIVAYPLLLIWKLPLYYLVPLLLQPFVKPPHKESNIIHFLILVIIMFTLTRG